MLFVVGTPWIARAQTNGDRGAPRPLALDQIPREKLGERIRSMIVEDYEFSGLAGYYNNLNFFITTDGALRKAKPGQRLLLKQGQWFVAKGRFNVFAMRWPGAVIEISEQRFEIRSFPADPGDVEAVIVAKPHLSAVAPELDELRYSHLGGLLGGLAKVMEWSLIAIHRLGVSNWGIVIIVFGVLLKVLLLPVGIIAVHLQRQVSQVTTQLAPRLADIKANYDGEEAHSRIMAAHKALGVSPFYTLKPLAMSLVQVPILVAIFNALGEMPQFAGAPFLWVEDLAYPDAVAHLAVAVPLVGDKVNLLPLLMTAVTVLSTLIFENPHALATEMKAQKRNLYLMAVAFLILSYPFPAAMVLYWVLANILQTVQQQIVKL